MEYGIHWYFDPCAFLYPLLLLFVVLAGVLYPCVLHILEEQAEDMVSLVALQAELASLPAGFEKPSAIQQRAIVPMTKGRDVIAQSQSGLFFSEDLPPYACEG
jgi:hypothetical protein